MENGTRIVVVTACPTGVALTYMAATRLLTAAQRLGYLIKVETQGALGSEDILTRKDISRAHAAIVASFHGVSPPTKMPISGPTRTAICPGSMPFWTASM